MTHSPPAALVTGGAGFIGSHIVDSFLAAGYRVSVIDSLRTGRRENLNPAATFHEIDLRDADAVERVLAAEQPAVISHQAAAADVRDSLAHPQEYAQINIVGTLNLLQAANAHGVSKIVFASTGGAVYGNPGHLPATEETPAAPLDPYGVSKRACEYYLESNRLNFGLDYCALRYGNVYGPRQNGQGEAGVVAIFTERMLAGAPVLIHGDGQNQRDFVFGPDVARANLLAATRGSGVYNIGTGVGTDINTVFARLAALTGYARPAERGPAKAGEVRATWMACAKADRELGWRPMIGLADGLAQTVCHYRGPAGTA